jgi:hypothetical protein
MKELSFSSNWGAKECNWYHKHSPGTMSGHIWLQCTELKAWRNRHGTSLAAPVYEVTNTVSSNSSKWIFDTSASSHMIPDRNYSKTFSSVCVNVVLADKTQVDYTDVSSVCHSCRLPSRDVSVALLGHNLFVIRLYQSLYS